MEDRKPLDPETRNVLRIEFQTYLVLLDARMARDRQQSSYDMYILFFPNPHKSDLKG